jgi:inward rectifier potassium channel
VPGSFLDCFFFSVQTVATIGYGELYPRDLYANLLVTAEITLGVMGFAVGNGLMFAWFSRPTARITFSRVAVIMFHNGVPTLMFRAANERRNLILEAHVRVSLVRDETSQEGRVMRRFRDLSLERRDNPTFLLSWTVMHVIDELSPFFGMTPEALAGSDMEIVVLMTGTDESFAQPVYARHSYRAVDIVWGKAFRDILRFDEQGRRIIDYGKFHEVEPIV